MEFYQPYRNNYNIYNNMMNHSNSTRNIKPPSNLFSQSLQDFHKRNYRKTHCRAPPLSNPPPQILENFEFQSILKKLILYRCPTPPQILENFSKNS